MNCIFKYSVLIFPFYWGKNGLLSAIGYKVVGSIVSKLQFHGLPGWRYLQGLSFLICHGMLKTCVNVPCSLPNEGFICSSVI